MQRRNTGIAMRKAAFLRLDQPDSMNVGGRQNSCCRSSMSFPDDGPAPSHSKKQFTVLAL